VRNLSIGKNPTFEGIENLLKFIIFLYDIMKEQIIIIIDGYKFDVTEYIKDHPGGLSIITQFKNKDATEAFNAVKGHNDGYVLNLLDELCIN